MRLLPVRLAALALLFTLGSCDDDPPATTADIGVGQGDQDSGVVDPTHCAALDECTCAQDPDCMPLTTDCWCPPDSCGSTADCSCSGGRYLGCNPRGAHCAGSQCALLAEPSVRDAHGCVTCTDPTDCSTAIAKLPALCPGMVAADAQWICDGGYDPCAAFCVASLRSCAAAECALCPSCSCGDDLFDSCLLECLSTAQNRH